MRVIRKLTPYGMKWWQRGVPPNHELMLSIYCWAEIENKEIKEGKDEWIYGN